MKKGQLSIEFMIILAVVLSIFIAVFSISQNRGGELQGIQTRLEAKNIADDLAGHINSISIAQQGTHKNLIYSHTLPRTDSYTIHIWPNSRLVEIIWTKGAKNQSYSAPIITSNINQLQNAGPEFNLSNNGGVLIE